MTEPKFAPSILSADFARLADAVVAVERAGAGSIDLALVMSVRPGFGGQKFIEGALGKVKSIREALDARRLAAELEVDGGIKPENAARVVAAGATVLVAGSAIFEDPDGPVAALRKFKEAIRR